MLNRWPPTDKELEEKFLELGKQAIPLQEEMVMEEAIRDIIDSTDKELAEEVLRHFSSKRYSEVILFAQSLQKLSESFIERDEQFVYFPWKHSLNSAKANEEYKRIVETASFLYEGSQLLTQGFDSDEEIKKGNKSQSILQKFKALLHF